MVQNLRATLANGELDSLKTQIESGELTQQQIVNATWYVRKLLGFDPDSELVKLSEAESKEAEQIFAETNKEFEEAIAKGIR